MVEKLSKYTENKCTHRAMMPIAKEISDMLDIGQKPSQVISVVFLTSKIAVGEVFPLCDGFRLLLSMAIDVPIT